MPAFWRKNATIPPAGDAFIASATPTPLIDEAIVASAARVTPGNLRYNRSSSDTSWQREAWDFYDTVAEFRYVCDWKSQAASRVKLFITTVDESGEPDTDAAGPIPFATTFLGGPAIQSQVIAAMVLHLEIVGLCFLIGQVLPDGGESWDVFSLDDLLDNGDGTISIDTGTGPITVLDPNASVIIKIWRPHPRKKAEANAPARAARAPLREIVRADQSIAAQIDSRLTGAGILLLPKELTFTISGANQDDGPGDDGGTDQFMTKLTESMMTSIADPDSVEAVVPIIIRGPGDQLDKVRLLTMSTPVSEATMTIRDGAVGRLARGLDVAAEVLLGMGNTNHLSGWQIEESNAKVHLANPLELICAALTEQYLWPAMMGQVPDYRRYVVWYDLSDLVQRPDRAADAQQVFDRGELSGTALRRENGFTENDQPTDDERRRHDLLEVAGKVPIAAPAVLSELLRDLGVNPANALPVAPAAGPGSQGRGLSTTAPAESRPLPSSNPAPPTTPNAPTNPAGPVQASSMVSKVAEQQHIAKVLGADAHTTGVVAAAEALTLRALETAGKRLVGRSRHKMDQLRLEAWDYHTAPGMACTPTSAERLLEGCFAACPVVAAAAGVNEAQLSTCLHDYVSALLCAGESHTSTALINHLRSSTLFQI
jgi:hypothetical protein